MTHAPIVLATKPFTGTPGPLAVAQWLAVREGRPLRLVCVMDPFEHMSDDVAVVTPPRYVEEDRESIAKRIDAALHQSPYARLETQVEVVDGSVPGTLERLVHEDNGSLLVMGRGRRSAFEGALAQEVLRTARVPLLIVPPEATARPLKRAIAAIDFSASSVLAVAQVLPLMASEGRLTLCHVRPPTAVIGDQPRPADTYVARCGTAFGRVIRSLPLTAGIQVDTVVLEGEIAARLDELVATREADILVCGRRSPGAPDTLLLGSVSSRLVRQARIPVLVSPDVSATARGLPEQAATAKTAASRAKRFIVA